MTDNISADSEKTVSLRTGIMIILGSALLVGAALYGIGSLFFWNQHSTETLAEQQERIITEFKKKNPGRVEAILAMGDYYLKQGLYDKAMKEYKTAEKQAPDNINIKFRIGFTAVQLKNYEEGIKYLEEFHKKQKMNFVSRVNLGIAYRETGNLDKAMEEFTFAYKLNSGAADLLLEMAKVDIARGDAEQALARLDKALAYVPDYQDALALKQKIEQGDINK